MQALVPVTAMPYLSPYKWNPVLGEETDSPSTQQVHWKAVYVSLPLPLSLPLFLLQSETRGGIQASGDSHGPGRTPPLAASRVLLVVLACHTRSVAKCGGSFHLQ